MDAISAQGLTNYQVDDSFEDRHTTRLGPPMWGRNADWALS